MLRNHPALKHMLGRAGWYCATFFVAVTINFFLPRLGDANPVDAMMAKGSANLATVAPGMAEALITTAIGLVAAIPAVMAYNYFIRRIRVIESETEAFAADYLNIVKRHFLQ